MSLAGCAFAEIPYDLQSVRQRPAAVHPFRVAVLPLIDDRAIGDGPDNDHFDYQGIEYEATDLGDLRGDARNRITELLANHLARAHLFAQVILVLDKSQAPEADLLLTGRIYRMRGYVESAAPDPKSGRDQDERMILSEVVLKDLALLDAKNPERALIKLDAGWSKHEARRLAGGEPTPWTVLAETLFVALDQVAGELAMADLSGKYDVRERVGLEMAPTSSTAVFGDLGRGPPHGWRFAETSSTALPNRLAGRGALPGGAARAATGDPVQPCARSVSPHGSALVLSDRLALRVRWEPGVSVALSRRASRRPAVLHPRPRGDQLARRHGGAEEAPADRRAARAIRVRSPGAEALGDVTHLFLSRLLIT